MKYIVDESVLIAVVRGNRTVIEQLHWHRKWELGTPQPVVLAVDALVSGLRGKHVLDMFAARRRRPGVARQPARSNRRAGRSGGPPHPFTPPAVSPLISCRCAT